MLLWAGLAVSGFAEEGRRVYVTLSLPCTLSYQVPDGALVPLGAQPAGSNPVQLPRQSLVLRARGGDLWRWWQGDYNLNSVESHADLRLQQEPNWVSLAALALLAGAGLAGWRYRGLRAQTRAAREEAFQAQPLIRSDGSLPTRPIGGYLVVDRLGAGAMGVVYRAQAYDGVPVAIKVPAPHLISDENFRSRWKREIKLGMELQHPRVVKVLCMPEGPDPYLVMEFVEGTTLEGVPLLPVEQERTRVLAWLRQSLDALAYIHSQGVIHRDLKPANLMVTLNGEIKLMDFGIAHKLHGTRLTATDTVLGTPIYMAPEQVQGQAVNERSDLFAIGLIFYERLAGSLPYPEDLMQMIRVKILQPLPLLRNVDPALAGFLARLTALDPADRFASAPEALRALEGIS